MKIFHYFNLLFLCAILLISCKETEPVPGVDGPGGNQPGENETNGYVAEAGVPDGELLEKSIGAAGGSIGDSAGRFTVSIPAGALPGNLMIGLQPITATNAIGKGTAYRLTPHGQTFQKPVTMTLHYTEDDLDGTIPEALGIAYQGDDKIWKAVGGAKLDTVQKIITIKTTHFSDWTLFETLRLVPAVKAIDPGQTVQVSVRRWKHADGDELLPLIPETEELAMMQNTEPLDPKYITGWQLMGEGKLTTSGNVGTYQAPSRIPAKNPAEIIVKLKSNGIETGFAISRIYVAPKGVSVQIAGGEWRTIASSGMNMLAGVNLVSALEDGHGLTIKWPGQPTGTFKWTLETVACYYNINGKQQYGHLYGMTPSISAGGVTAHFAGGDHGRIAVGHFNVPSSGYIDGRIPEQTSYTTTSMKGVFRVDIY